MDPDEVILGYYDNDDEFDDSLFLQEEPVIEEKVVVKELNVGILTNDLMREILCWSDMNTFVKLCSSSKDMRKLCTDQLWKYKFAQYNITSCATSFLEWSKLYQQHLRDSEIYQKTNTFIKSRPKYLLTTELQRELPNKQFKDLIEKVGYHEDLYSPHRRIKTYNLTIDYHKEGMMIENYSLSFEQFREFIFQLFKQQYLDDKWLYLK